MTESDELIDRIIFTGEGPTADYKAEQYAFIGAPDGKKSEIVKDILAFANAYRSSDAHILIGVKARAGQLPEVLGCTEHLDDADLQQLVNSKTNRPIQFSYRDLEFRGVRLGLFTIPVQERPLFLKADFGPLKKHAVYVRRGSSTDIADPAEISQMGALAVGAAIPTFNLEFADLRSRTAGGRVWPVQSRILEGVTETDAEEMDGLGLPDFDFGRNRRYHRELLEYATQIVQLKSIGFMLENTSGVLGQGVRVEFQFELPRGVSLLDPTQAPRQPKQSTFDLYSPVFNSDVTVSKHGKIHRLEIEFGKSQPRSTLFTSNAVLAGSSASGVLAIRGHIFGDNFLPQPIGVEINFQSPATIALSKEGLFGFSKDPEKE